MLDFWEFYGPANIREYMYKTARDAGVCVCVCVHTTVVIHPIVGVLQSYIHVTCK